MTDPDRDDPRIEMLGRAAHTINVGPLDAHRVVEVARTRRRRTFAVGIGAVAVAVIATGTALAATGENRDTPQRPDVADTATETPREPDTAAPLPAPPAGTKWVGQNGVAVAVPTDWAVTEQPCGVEAVAFVFDATSEPSVDCDRLGGQVATVRFDPIREGADGYPLSCLDSLPEGCTASRVFDDDGAAAQVTVLAFGEDRTEVVGRILDSAITVPDGWATVPFGWGTQVEERLDALEGVGLKVKVLDRDRLGQYEVTLSPQGGTLVREGTTVTLAPTDIYPLGLICGSSQETGVDLDVPGPGQPTPAEAVAPYANGLALSTTRLGDGQAEVRGVDAEGLVRQVFRASERTDGWWLDGYLECRPGTS